MYIINKKYTKKIIKTHKQNVTSTTKIEIKYRQQKLLKIQNTENLVYKKYKKVWHTERWNTKMSKYKKRKEFRAKNKSIYNFFNKNAEM